MLMNSSLRIPKSEVTLQGCSLSTTLLIIFIDSMANTIRNDKRVSKWEWRMKIKLCRWDGILILMALISSLRIKGILLRNWGRYENSKKRCQNRSDHILSGEWQQLTQYISSGRFGGSMRHLLWANWFFFPTVPSRCVRGTWSGQHECSAYPYIDLHLSSSYPYLRGEKLIRVTLDGTMCSLVWILLPNPHET